MREERPLELMSLEYLGKKKKYEAVQSGQCLRQLTEK